jgi:ribA/ribD-fused uncharacterized protein
MTEIKKPYQTMLREAVMSVIHQNTELTIDGFVDSPRGDFRWLSNFEPCVINFGGYVYPSTEHAYHAMKTFVDEERLALSKAETPSKSKTLGQKVTLRPDWEMVKADCMEYCLQQKFARGTELAKKLIATVPADLIETNWWHDNYWGTCICPKCNNKGLNTLGKLLMKIRDELQVEKTA